MKPNNQHQLALWYLIQFPIVNLKFVINDSMFYKFQSRLSTLEKKHGAITKKEWVKFTNKFGHNSRHMTYACTDVEKAKELFYKYEPKKPIKK